MIINLTQHVATAEQVLAGVQDLPEQERQELQRLLTFGEMPNKFELRRRAHDVARLARRVASDKDRAMIGGAPYFMAHLEHALWEKGIPAVYAFSQRESVEEVQADGSVVKRNVFRHLGFVESV